MPETPENHSEKKIKLHVDPEIEYKYRDLFNIHISTEDVILELGNIQRGGTAQGAIKDVIVMSPSTAIRLQQALAQSIGHMQEKMKEIQQKNQSN